MNAPLECLNYIDGNWQSARSHDTLESHNPANNLEVVATFPSSGNGDIDLAVAAARQAYRSWRDGSRPSSCRLSQTH